MLPPPVISAAYISLALQSSLAPASTALRTHISLSRRPRPHRQIRTFRTGLWSSYLDIDYQKEVQRRQRIMRHKYFEALSRKLSWDRHPSTYIRPRGLKGFMCSAWNGRDKRPGGRWINIDNVDAFQNPQKNKEGGIEEVEQTPVDRLLKNHNDIIKDMIRTRARLFGSSWSSSETPDATTSNPSTAPLPTDASWSSSNVAENFGKPLPSGEVEYEIDPITNRKVFKKQSSRTSEPYRAAMDIPTQSFQLYRSQFQKMSSHPQDQARECLNDGRELKEETKPVYYMEPPEKDSETPSTVLAGLKDFDDKASYGPVYYKEPDGKDPKIPCQVQKGLKDYDEKTTYGPVYYKEPDGRDPKKPCSVEAGLKEHDDKASYGPVYYNEPDGKNPEKPCSVQQGLSEYDAKTSYGPVYYKEPDGKDPEITCPVQRGLKDYDDKVSYGPLMYREPDGKAPEKSCSVQEGLKDFDAKANYGSSKKSSTLPASTKLRRPPSEERLEDLDLLRASDIRAAAGLSKASRKETESEKASKRRQLEADFRTSRKKFIEDLKIEHSEILNHVAHARGKINAKIAEVEAGWPKPQRAGPITGNFVRDFPEEFSTTWSTAKSSSGSLLPNVAQEQENKVQAAEKLFSDTLGSGEITGQGPGTRRIESSLDRNRLPKKPLVKMETVNKDGRQLKTPKILEENDANLVREVQQIYEDTYGTIDFDHRQALEQRPVPTNVSALSQPEVPTVYKILAYDPTMQSISEAETTSIVPDSASPLTPAEVLLRLSNPAKFFPHFAPLQSQGYEIVSGSGDVLVFRKVHPGAPSFSLPEDEPSFAKKEYKRLRRNPIDGMQPIAATGNFASPTGFVNYDLAEDHEQTEPPFKSNIDVRREEAVFSGRSNWQDTEDSSSPTKKGRGKRLLIGAFWVGACSYAVGVVAEFFRTGGMDGMGPKGF